MTLRPSFVAAAATPMRFELVDAFPFSAISL
jgi:hypothetical protein